VPLPLPYSFDEADGSIDASDEVVVGEVVDALFEFDATELTCTGVSAPTVALALCPPAIVVVFDAGASAAGCETPEESAPVFALDGIVADGAGFAIEDAGSTNGTFVDGERVSRAPLHAGASIVVGETVLEVRG